MASLVVAIIGRTKTGKTTLIERLIKIFKEMGYRVGTVKHHRGNFDFDLEGKDSWRHRQAGADVVVMSSPSQLAFIQKQQEDASLKEIQQMLGNKVDIILAEGFKNSFYPKIEVYRHKENEHDLLASRVEGVVGIVTDETISTDLPIFRWSEIDKLAEFLKGFLQQK
ncbi:MAG: molybdopterin-guanine dinucleotide biosynthesis protein B [Candidatus Desulfofervidaceae bacterium]|nr:molybdopterin-guanine dinucleotide biosynthesis protein B [Candidatus Desulfofervidaceae bacterium]MDL1971316.1 molybdopterin-guanine dinucleotide biosynthesis protein B [Candidatus Desulfofervidaceae bacterium]